MSLATEWSTMPASRAAPAYASLILERVRQGMPSDDWLVPWAGAPATSGYFPGCELRALPLPRSGVGIYSHDAADTIQAITDGLYLAYAPTALRLSVNLNDETGLHSHASSAKWGRTTASGGGRYCVDIYLVQGENGDIPTGVHHYSPVHNGWEHIDPHDRTEELRVIQGYAERAQRYVCYSINYWQSAFKYNDFAYQATAMDMGTVIGSLYALWGARTAGSWDMNVNESALADLLGLDQHDEGVYAIQAWGSVPPEQPRNPGVPSRGRRGATAMRGGLPPRRFPTTIALQHAMATEHLHDRCQTVTVGASGQPADLSSRVADALARETSFGRFTGAPIDLAALRDALDAGADAARALTFNTDSVKWEYLVYASAVRGLAPGLYRCTDRGSDLQLLRERSQQDFLASSYFLRNYDGRLAAATVILCASIFEASRREGVHGYRFANALAGACCQGLSTGAVRAGLSTGTALGFDARAVADHAGLDTERMCPLLMIMIGKDDPTAGRLSMKVWGESR